MAKELVGQVEDNEWYFDTKLLLLAEERGYRVSEVAVDWIETSTAGWKSSPRL